MAFKRKQFKKNQEESKMIGIFPVYYALMKNNWKTIVTFFKRRKILVICGRKEEYKPAQI